MAVLLFSSRAHKSWMTGLILIEFEIDQDFMSVLIAWKLKETQIKNDWEKLETHFPH